MTSKEPSAPDTTDKSATTAAAGPAISAVRAVNVSKSYGSADTQVTALDDVTVTFDAASFTAIMGPSGSGKSTLMHCMAGLDDLSAGQVFIGDVCLSDLSERKLTALRRDRIGFVFQSFNLVPTLTASENITLPVDLAGRRPDRDWFNTVIDAVGLGDRLKHRPSELSGGQQQRVAVARALVAKPDVIFADEPTGNLDSRSGGEVLHLLRAAVDEFGQTLVMVTHDPSAAAHADRVVFLADGAVRDDIANPDVAGVLERMARLGGL